MFEIQVLPENAHPVAEVYADDDKLHQFFLDGTTIYMRYNNKLWNTGSNISLQEIMGELYEYLEPTQAFGRHTVVLSPSVFYEKLHHTYITHGYIGVNIQTTC